MNVPYITKNENGWLTVEGIGDFSVFRTFDCGQCFRFDPVSLYGNKYEYGGVAYGKYITVAQDENDVTIYGSDAEDFRKIWINYLGLDFDIEGARNNFKNTRLQTD